MGGFIKLCLSFLINMDIHAGSYICSPVRGAFLQFHSGSKMIDQEKEMDRRDSDKSQKMWKRRIEGA